MSKDFFTDVSLSQERALSYSLPDLLVGSHTQLIQFAYNTQTQKYEPESTVDLEETSSPARSWQLLALSDSIIVGKNHESRPNQQETGQSQAKIIKLSQSLEQLKIYECADIAAMATDENYIFVCTEGKLVALNQDLETLDEVDLALEGRGWRKKKNAHDILIYQSIAYLLDNVIEPTYILQVDISNPNHLQILSTFDITGVNHHLRGQWINPELKQWCIIQQYGTQAGSGENIIILPLDLDSGSVDVRRSQIPFPTSYLNKGAISLLEPFLLERDNYYPILGYESINYASFDSSHKLGFYLRSATSSSPTWGLISDQQERFYLAEVQTFNEEIAFPSFPFDDETQFKKKLYSRIKFQHKLYLGEFEKYHEIQCKITLIEQLLFLFIQGSENQGSFTRLLIIDVAQEPSIILSQGLEGQNSYGLTMSYLLLPQNKPDHHHNEREQPIL